MEFNEWTPHFNEHYRFVQCLFWLTEYISYTYHIMFFLLEPLVKWSTKYNTTKLIKYIKSSFSFIMIRKWHAMKSSVVISMFFTPSWAFPLEMVKKIFMHSAVVTSGHDFLTLPKFSSWFGVTKLHDLGGRKIPGEWIKGQTTASWLGKRWGTGSIDVKKSKGQNAWEVVTEGSKCTQSSMGTEGRSEASTKEKQQRMQNWHGGLPSPKFSSN